MRGQKKIATALDSVTHTYYIRYMVKKTKIARTVRPDDSSDEAWIEAVDHVSYRIRWTRMLATGDRVVIRSADGARRVSLRMTRYGWLRVDSRYTYDRDHLALALLSRARIDLREIV